MDELEPSIIKMFDDGKNIASDFKISKDASDDEKTIMYALSIILNSEIGFDVILRMANHITEQERCQKKQPLIQ